MRVPLSLSLHLPSFTYPDTGADRLFEKLVDIATTCESSGYSGVTVMDHLHQIPGVGDRTEFMLEGNTTLAGLAARTSRLNLGLLVGGVTYRNPALMAKITTTLDVISGGRVFLGIGAAWFEEEHLAYGYPFPPLRERFELLEDALNIARRMFTQSESSYEGKRFVDRATRSTTRSRCAATSRSSSAARASGRRCGWSRSTPTAATSSATSTPSGTCSASWSAHCEDVGRDPAEITKTRMATIFLGERHEDAVARLEASSLNERMRAMAIAGDPDGVGEQVQALMDAGIEGLTIRLTDAYDLETVARAGETLSPLLGARV